MHGNPSPVTHAAHADDGFTVIEVLVAVLILTVGLITLVGTFDPARRLGSEAEVRQVASAFGEQELQRVQSLPWAQIALKSQPASNPSRPTTDPTHYVTASPCAQTTGPNTQECFRWDWNGPSPVEGVDVDTINGDGTANPTAWKTTINTSAGITRLTGNIYRYVTWATDLECTAAACGGTSDYKRVTVVVTATGLTTPVVLSALVSNPASATGASTDPLTDATLRCSDTSTNPPTSVSCVG